VERTLLSAAVVVEFAVAVVFELAVVVGFEVAVEFVS
jgi:hypothetical protein